MKQYIIQIIHKETGFHVFPPVLLTFPLWKNNISPLLKQCGFRICENTTIQGDDNNLIEFWLTYKSDDAYRCKIIEMIY